MVWCYYCGQTIYHPNYVDGKVCCTLCGRVLDEDNFSQEPTFVKNASGQSQLSGNYVKTIQSNFSASRERILNEAYDGITSLMYALQIDGGDSIARPALKLYQIAVERQFTRGRRKEQIEAACLYIICRQNQKPYLLIDFSEHLRINVYVLGAVFLQLCKLLSLLEDPIVQKPVDPSLFIHRFTDRLFGGRKSNVSRTALRILYHMKRDWMQTGRKPSGLCGAALYISSLSHGLTCSKSEIIKVVHVCEATLTKRLIEFENTESGGLTVEEFNTRAEELEKEERLMKSQDAGSQQSGASELLCEHKGSGKYFRHGLCRSCYNDFIELSGGLDGGSEPPAFQRAEKERLMAKEAAAKGSENFSTSLPDPAENDSQPSNHDKERNSGGSSQCEGLPSSEGGLAGSTMQEKISHDDQAEGVEDVDASEKSESLSDIDETEVNGYLHTEEEKVLKKLIWETMNKEYIEEQRAKEEAAKRKSGVDYSNCSGDVEAALKLRDSVMEAHDKSKKQKREKRAEELKNLGPARTPGEAAKQMLQKKQGLSSKIRWDAVKDLLDDPVEIPEDVKKTRIEQAEFDPYDDDLDNGREEDPELEEPDSEIIEEGEEIDFF